MENLQLEERAGNRESDSQVTHVSSRAQARDLTNSRLITEVILVIHTAHVKSVVVCATRDDAERKPLRVKGHGPPPRICAARHYNNESYTAIKSCNISRIWRIGTE